MTQLCSLELANLSFEHEQGGHAPEDSEGNHDSEAFPVSDCEALLLQIDLRKIQFLWWDFSVEIVELTVSHHLICISNRRDPLDPVQP